MAVTTQPSALALLYRTTLRLATCWQLERTDGTILRFTDHSQELHIGGHLFTPTSGFSSSAKQKSSKLQPTNFEARGAIASESLVYEDLRAGKYRDAKITEYVVDWMYPWADAVVTAQYWIDTLTYNGEAWEAQVSSISERFKKPLGIVLSRNCRHTLGDSICRVDLEATGNYENFAVVTSVGSDPLVDFSASAVSSTSDDYWKYGLVIWLTGENSGLEVEVRGYTDSGRVFQLRMPMPIAVSVGDVFNVTVGCDKLLQTCLDKFDNVINFGGFPAIPGNDAIVQGPTRNAGPLGKK